MPATKIATCCYCGTRAALRLQGKTRHELTCSNCGAPLRKMKMIPAQVTAPAATPTRPAHPTAKNKKPRKSKRKASRIWAKIWDEVEDVFEDIFD